MIAALRSGVSRGGIEIRQTLTTPLDLWNYLFPALGLLVTIFFMRNAHVPGTTFSLGARTLPSSLGMGLAFGGLVLVAISGVFYPIASMPGWLQGVAQIFPIYWLGLGMRSVFLPDALSAVELTHSWRHLEMFGVLTVWAAVGLLLAPVILRRMARRESGSAVAARRDRMLATVGR